MTNQPPVSTKGYVGAESFGFAIKNRLFSFLARFGPGGKWRVRFHRWRGVKIGNNVTIGPDTIVETAFPHWVSIGDDVQIGTRVLILARIHSLEPSRLKIEGDSFASVRIEAEANVGAGVIILPNVRIGRGAVVAAGSVVTASVPPMTMVQGNPAVPVARCGLPLTWDVPLKEFMRQLKPLGTPSKAPTRPK